VNDPFAYLFGLEQFGIKFGLENMVALVERLGHPERAFRTAHIAGTNGKGSVTAMIDTALKAAGHRSARYTSPHLVDLAERFVIDGEPAPDAAIGAAITDVQHACESLLADGTLRAQPTFFEVTTAVAFELFRRAGVGVAVVEVGLGGRLDATNVVQPLTTAITSIAFDHERYLGTTLHEIAIEKAGIIKPGVPVVVGEMPSEALAAIAGVAAERGAPLIHATPDAWGYGHVTLALAGAHQRANAAVAAAVLGTLDASGMHVPAEAVAEGLSHVRWPGRLEWRELPGGRQVLLDAAHNPAGAEALASYLHAHALGGLPLVFAAMRDKDAAGIVGALAPAVGHIVVTRASNPRSSDPDALAARIRQIAPGLAVTTASSPADALAAAWRLNPRVIVAGSIFLLGDVMREIRG
jgi:dihydrofolate synthase/folylpolyglutamate synthase